MPNHITNIIQLKGDDERVRKLLETVKSDELGIGSIDFNKLIPMPECLNIEAGSRTDDGLKAYRDFMSEYVVNSNINELDVFKIPKEKEADYLKEHTNIGETEWELGRQAFRNMVKYKVPTWYEWCIQHWGTKWNAYYVSEDRNSAENTIAFNTAWSAPHVILKKMSEMFPDVTIEHKWADEDIGNNCGERIYKGGSMESEYIPETEKEAIEYAAEIMEVEPSDYGLVLNANESRYIFGEREEYELVELLGHTALFSNGRLTDNDIPKGLHCYHLRETDTGDRFFSVEPSVKVNHGGSVILKEPLDFGKNGFIAFTEDTSPNFLGRSITFNDFMQMSDEELAIAAEPEIKM